jgi:para-aminobenzoate synthetase / 4-amino-4-deoxychorismate lyase
LFAERAPADPLDRSPGAFVLSGWQGAPVAVDYAGQIARIREWIAAGDTYQVNHTLRLRASFSGEPLELYARLCRAQAAAHCALLDLGSHVIVSASPELFFRWSDGELEVRPMKGTRPRGRWVEEDDRLAEELLGSEKERAENLMIVDLLRNDAGRISRFGSVEVPRLFEVERYPTVHQLTSTIRSRTRGGTTLTDVFRALFPCGSVTGAPKVRTMQIIAELENAPRGVYTGALGFVTPDEAVFSVAIRTLVLDRASGQVELGVGGGITHDSEASSEFQECFAKAAFVRHEPREFALLETLRFDPGSGYFLLDEHLARLEASARYFDFPYDAPAVHARLCEEAAHLRHGARVRLLLDRAGSIAVGSEPLRESTGPVRVCVARQPVDSCDASLYHKTTDRGVYLSRLAAHPGADDVLLVNERGQLTESTIANLVVERDGALWTPPVEVGLLPGVFRGVLLREGRLRERLLYPEDLSAADAVYLINSVRKWRIAEMMA